MVQTTSDTTVLGTHLDGDDQRMLFRPNNQCAEYVDDMTGREIRESLAHFDAELRRLEEYKQLVIETKVFIERHIRS